MGYVEARRHLRSSTAGNLIMPATNTQLGQRAFSVAAVKFWNNLPINSQSSTSVTIFKKAR